MKNRKFRQKVKENRKLLRDAGYKPPTIHSWESGTYPNLQTAIKLSALLNLKVSEIPYYNQVREDSN